MRHPNEVQLALFAGGELDVWHRWQVRRHVARCSGCERELQALRDAREQVSDAVAELPKDLNWNRLAEEMTGNIRVGLAAGEAIARFDGPAGGKRPLRLGRHAALVLAGATLVFVAVFWTTLPREQTQHLTAALQKIFSGQIGHRVVLPQDEVVLEATSAAIEVKENGRSMALMHPRSDAVTVSVNMNGSAGVRYVDADTGQVTTTKVYYAEQ